MLFTRYAIFSLVVASTATLAQANYITVTPSGWSVGAAGSTSQYWYGTAKNVNEISGAPDVYNDAGAGLTAPTLSATGGGFIASSGGFYSFSGNYGVTTTIDNNNASAPANAGTHIIVQLFSTLGENDTKSVLGLQLTDTSNNSIGAQLLQTAYYNAGSVYVPAIDSYASMETSLYEFWIPNFTGDFKVSADILIHSSLSEFRVDSMVAAPAPSGGSPFAVTAVPEPASLALAGLGVAALLLRRR